MYINKTLLQLLTNYDQFKKLNNNIAIDRFDVEERTIITQLRKYWKMNDEVFSMEVFSQKFFLDVQASEPERVFYRGIFNEMLLSPDADIAENIIRDLRIMEFNKEVEGAQTEYVTGGEIDLFDEVHGLCEKFESDVRRTAKDEYCDASLQEVIEDNTSGSNLDWKLECLRQSMPNIRTGMQVIVGMRPGMGKTSFCADNGVHWLQSELARESKRPILWFNNEGKKIRIKGSFVRSALGKDFPAIAQMGYEKAEADFNKVLGGKDRLRIYDIHGKDTTQIERIIERDNPLVVFWDMMDNIRLPGNNSMNREDQTLEAIYQWGRETAVKYDFLSVPTSQVSIEGAGLQWIPESALKGSKTGKQGACDAIITIGSKDEPGFEYSRYVYVAKLFKGSPEDGADPRCRTQVVFNPATCRYLNPKTV